VAGATLRASRTMTKAIASSSTTAAPSAMTTVFFELDVDPVEPVVSVFCVVVASCEPPWLSSLNAPLSPLPPTASAAGASAQASDSRISVHATSGARRPRSGPLVALDMGRAYPPALRATNARWAVARPSARRLGKP
jgi:hypothetical protein